MQPILLIVGHLKHYWKEKFSLYGLIIILDGFYVVGNKTYHTLNGDIDSKDILEIVVVFNGDHDKSFLRGDVGGICDEKGLVPLRVVSVENGRTESAWILWQHIAELCPTSLDKDLWFDGVSVRDVEGFTHLQSDSPYEIDMTVKIRQLDKVLIFLYLFSL